MKPINTIIAIAFVSTLVACGGANTAGDSSSTTGTVEVVGETGSTTSSNLTSYLTTQETADEVLIRTYRISLGDSADCETANFSNIFDQTDDTSDCVQLPSDTTNFSDFASSAELGSGGSIPAGDYSCVRVTMCDKIVWTASALTQCSGEQTSDVYGSEDEAEVATYYWSTSGTDNDDEDSGSATTPFPLTDSLTVTAGNTTTMVINMSNGGTSGMTAEFSDDNDESRCEVLAPEMSVTAE